MDEHTHGDSKSSDAKIVLLDKSTERRSDFAEEYDRLSRESTVESSGRTDRYYRREQEIDELATTNNDPDATKGRNNNSA